MNSRNRYLFNYEDSKNSPTNIALNRLNLEQGQIFSLHYNFGDDWMFTIRVAAIKIVKEYHELVLTKSRGHVAQYPNYEEECG